MTFRVSVLAARIIELLGTGKRYLFEMGFMK